MKTTTTTTTTTKRANQAGTDHTISESIRWVSYLPEAGESVIQFFVGAVRIEDQIADYERKIAELRGALKWCPIDAEKVAAKNWTADEIAAAKASVKARR